MIKSNWRPTSVTNINKPAVNIFLASVFMFQYIKTGKIFISYFAYAKALHIRSL